MPGGIKQGSAVSGMTLIEMLIALSIAGIFIVVVSGSFNSVREFAARSMARGESERLANEIVQLTRAKINTRNADGLNLADKKGDDYRFIEVDRTVNGKTEEMLISTSCESGPKGVVVPAACGISCGPGSRPVTKITIERAGRPKVERTFPPSAATGKSAAADAVGAVVCARQTTDAIQLRANVFYGRGKGVRLIARQANMPASFFMQKEAALVP